jgi:glycerol-3-phosphate dehydrogenase
LKCLLVEDYDFASGTSSKSTKLIHGGVRYLEQAFSWNQTERLEKIGLVAEALRDRSYMIQNAQYLNKPLPIIIPSTSLFWAGYYYAGVFLYQMIYYAFDDDRNMSHIPFPYIIGKQDLSKIYPKLDSEVNYGVVYYDGQTNDSRMNLDVILTSTLDNYLQKEKMNPANVLNYTRFLDFIKDSNGKIVGAELLDKLTNKKFTVKTKVAVNCTGAFADEIRKKDNPSIPSRIVPALGSHLILDKKLVNKKYGLLIPKTTDGRVLFVLPWQDHTLVGTTDILKEKPDLNPTVSFDEMMFMTKEVHQLFPKVDITDISSSIKSKWAGIRPLVKTNLDESDKSGKIDTKSLARTHVIETTKSGRQEMFSFNFTGLISLMGGKWTIYRQMGEDTVNEILKYMKGKNRTPCYPQKTVTA